MNNKRSRDPPGYRPFSCGWTLCPGRHIATSMILRFAAATIMTLIHNLAVGNGWLRLSRTRVWALLLVSLMKILIVEVWRRNAEEWTAVYRAWDFLWQLLFDNRMIYALVICLGGVLRWVKSCIAQTSLTKSWHEEPTKHEGKGDQSWLFCHSLPFAASSGVGCRIEAWICLHDPN